MASRDTKEVNVASRLMADIIAESYEKALKLHARGKLLDLGCGKVPLYEAYKKYITKNICVDWESTLHKNEYLDLECDINKELPFEQNEFDTVILSDVLEHIPEPEHLLKEISRVLAHGGKLIMNVPFYYWIHEQPHDYYRYTEFALKRLMKNAGLVLVEFKVIGGPLEILADIIAKNVQSLPLVGSSLAILAQKITYIFAKTTVGQKISNGRSELFPFGYFLVATKPGKRSMSL